MRNERFHPSTCRGKFQKLGIILSKCQAHPHNTKQNEKNPKFAKKRGELVVYQIAGRGRRGNHWLLASPGPPTIGRPPVGDMRLGANRWSRTGTLN
jgi:hypothetical protein